MFQGWPRDLRNIEALPVEPKNTMNPPPIVSVCVASYNHARFLPAMLDGLLGQTFRDFEIVVVDDGSTDNSLEVLQGYAHRNPWTMPRASLESDTCRSSRSGTLE